MRVPRRCSLITTPRLRSSASAEDTVAGLMPGLGGERCARRAAAARARARPAATARFDLRDERSGARASILYCSSSVTHLYYYRVLIGGSNSSWGWSRHRVAAPGPASDRVRLRRKRERGHYDREVIDAILDEALIAHLGIVDEAGQPFVTRSCTRARGDVVYLPRLGRGPDDARDRGRGAAVPDGVADRRARAGALGDAPLRQLPLGDAARPRAARSRIATRSSSRSRRSSNGSCPGAGPTRAGRARRSCARPRSWRWESTKPRRRSGPAARWTTRRTTRSTCGRAWSRSRCSAGPAEADPRLRAGMRARLRRAYRRPGAGGRAGRRPRPSAARPAAGPGAARACRGCSRAAGGPPARALRAAPRLVLAARRRRRAREHADRLPAGHRRARADVRL